MAFMPTTPKPVAISIHHFEYQPIGHLEVRPIFHGEQTQWNDLVKEHHYLGLRALVGETMRYVAILDGQWVALIGFGAAALKSRHRDGFIGWKPAIQWQRLMLVANNVRFLILPDIRIKNLASKVLSLTTKRLSADWQEVHGHPILLVETFVDDSRFLGTCYKASGWLPLGKTRGFRRNGKKYYHHGNVKTIFVRVLSHNALQLLADPLPHPELLPEEVAMNLNAIAIETTGGLVDYLRTVPDPRMKRGIRHRMLCVLTVAVCAVLSGAQSYIAIGEWAKRSTQDMRKRMGCRYDRAKGLFITPSEPTLRRTLQAANAQALDTTVSLWMKTQTTIQGNAIAIDGKTSRGSTTKEGKQTHLLSAFLHKQGIVIAQQAVDIKSNEITTLRPLLADLDITGCVVTADALHTQKDAARFIVEEKHADYLFTVKDNQPTLREDIENLDIEAFSPCTPNRGQGPRPT
jgi:hypothetical protein